MSVPRDMRPEEFFNEVLENGREYVAGKYQIPITDVQRRIRKIQKEHIDSVKTLDDIRETQNKGYSITLYYGKLIKKLAVTLFDKEYNLKKLYTEDLMMQWDIVDMIGLDEVQENTLKDYYSKNHYVLSEEDYKAYITKRTAITKERIYGDKYYSNHEKRKKTTLEKYGVDHVGKIPEFHDKMRETMVDRYGVDNAVSVEQFRAKINKTMIERYGAEWYGASDKGRENAKTHVHPLSWKPTKYVKTPEESQEVYKDTQKFIDLVTSTLNPEDLTIANISRVTGLSYYSIVANSPAYSEARHILDIKHPYDGLQKEVTEYVSSLYKGKINKTTKPPFMEGLELDIYLPDLGFAIEVNGTYFHSEARQSKSGYHQHKTELARKAGVSLMHIWEYDWIDYDKQEIIKSQIKHKLGLSNRVYARKTTVGVPSTKEYTDFENDNHLQGHANSSIQYALYLDNEIVALATFSKPRFSKEADYELVRYVTKKGTTVVGGLSKLLSHLRKEVGTKITLLTYANNDFAYSNNKSIYSRLGFTYQRTTEPGYSWVEKYRGTIVSRYMTQPKKLLKKYPDDFRKDNPRETENEFMYRKGYVKIWDAGNDVYLLTID